MADSPDKYQLGLENEDDIIDRVTRQKIPLKKGQKKGNLLGSKKRIGDKGDNPLDSNRRKI